MRIPLASVLVSLLGASCAPKGAPPSTPAVSLAGHPATRAHEVACELTDTAGPRLAGSPGDAAARAWALEAMRRLGLSEVREEPVTVPHWERGPISVSVVAPSSLELSALALGGSVPTPADGITADVLRVTSLEELAAIPEEQVRGKIVFFDKRMERLRDGFQSYGKTVDVRSRGAIAAAKKGAVASLIRSVATSNARFPHTGAMRYEEGTPRIPAAALAVPDADILARMVARGQTPRVRLVLAATQHPDAISGNVIGEVRGREKPDEIVLLGAHLDSWDVGPGGVDDAAGVAIALEVARLLRQDPPRRTVRIVLYANEENGLKGAYAYAKAHADELARHQVAMEVDGGAGLAWWMEWRAGDAAAPVFQRLFARLRPLGVEGIEHDDETGGADLIPLTDSGMPKVGLRQDARRYFDLHHSADDTCDKIDPAEIAQVTAATHVIIRELAEMPDRLPPVPPKPKKD